MRFVASGWNPAVNPIVWWRYATCIWADGRKPWPLSGSAD
jgi:hypothetical protein